MALDKDTIRGYKESARIKWGEKIPAKIIEVRDCVNGYCGYCSLAGCFSCGLRRKGVCDSGNDSAFRKIYQSLEKALLYAKQMETAIKADMADDEGE
ncbi:MAG TPA: hypothetical protein ENH85_03265 [Candidatus Scalindua sp.]|nr:hypothetical protein [Candidatus Scalindua sp.]